MVPFVGPSYQLDFRKSDVQRSVNLFLSITESGTSKAPAVLQSIPGYTLFAALGSAVRCVYEAAGRCFVVAAQTLYEVYSSGAFVSRGTLITASGRVSMSYGLFQLVIVDGDNGYVLTLSNNTFAQITSTAWRGSNQAAFLDGYFIFVDPGTQQFYWSRIDDATTLDALDFASAESSPDDIVAHLTDHRDVVFLGEKSVEAWRLTGTSAVFERNEGGIMDVGCAATHSAKKLDNTFFWVGNDANGDGVVWMAAAYQPRRISTRAVEEALQASSDISSCVAYVYQQDGHSFYCLNVPGWPTTWVFDVLTQSWHERAELVNGAYTQIRGTTHAYCFKKHLIGADDGNLYYLDKTKNTLNGDVLVRDRISPHDANPSLTWKSFSKFLMDCIVGKGKPDGSAPSLMLRYSNDGGNAWSSWREVSLGAIGEFTKRVVFFRLGRARDRVWQVRCTDDTQFSIVNALAE